ncbi:hypothetical protein P872_12905 [Rhodonellum psychrophilum GCM71 = DSM 17998]|uniref:Uncharacterized protein n=1 Tax=Rhodonellum psychrophilum GCM71 = DSM 17998 TaxID=1123057 RepID=U5BSW8_9BACT|nr:hypothetical protein [Rhodonellum ikkaensis]ERM80624.1 hypothetical protein P872_12905 [Rhodonellum psychrophilum GCM71 = DSM 17998]
MKSFRLRGYWTVIGKWSARTQTTDGTDGANDNGNTSQTTSGPSLKDLNLKLIENPFIVGNTIDNIIFHDL